MTTTLRKCTTQYSLTRSPGLGNVDEQHNRKLHRHPFDFNLLLSLEGDDFGMFTWFPQSGRRIE